MIARQRGHLPRGTPPGRRRQRRRAGPRRARRSKVDTGTAPPPRFALPWCPHARRHGHRRSPDRRLPHPSGRLARPRRGRDAALRRRARRVPHRRPGDGDAARAVRAPLGARRIFEIGSGFGYSAFWFARVLETGSTVTLTDFDRENLDRARAWLGKAGLLDRCRFEPAGDGLEALARAESGIDLVFLDGEKAEYPKALAIALPKLRAGGLVLADNVLWGGAVARGESDAATAGLREYTRVIFGSEGLVSTIVPIRDGLAITFKR